jgi:uncharacterized membrane protein
MKLKFLTNVHTSDLLKSVGYRLYSTILTVFIAYMITNSFEHSLNIGVVEFVLKVVSYFIYEKIWNTFRK